MKIKWMVCCALPVVFMLPLGAQAGIKQVSPGAYTPPAYEAVRLGNVKPTGWLKRQLQIMRKGSSGHLDEYYSKIKNDNGWLGGRGDGWEETPYWLDGALPLAYLLDDDVLKYKVLRYVNWTLDHQRKSGYFGPLTNGEITRQVDIDAAHAAEGEDWWPKMVMLKVLQQYYSATEDKRVIKFMSRYFRYQLEALKVAPVGKWTEWAQSRGAENVMMAQWLYSITEDDYLLELAETIEQQSFPWTTWFGNRDWVINTTTYRNNTQWMNRHAVNVAMGLKAPAVNYQRTGKQECLQYLRTGWQDLMTIHGLPMGIFSGDEDLNGNDPTQGVELCAIVEAMYSLENISAITGDVFYMDALEKMAFNALPTQTTDDYNEKQYFQVANQLQISRGVFNFSLPFDREMCNVLGARSGYTCCLANMHQGWTKYTSHLWYQTSDKGLAALEYGPCTMTAEVGKKHRDVTITEVTDYPFNEEIRFQIAINKETEFPLQLRIPAWCNEAVILLNGQPLRKDKGGQIITIEREWKDKDELTLQLPMTIKTGTWGRNSSAVERGPLVYALKLEERWVKDADPAEGAYYSVYPTGDWNFALRRNDIRHAADSMKVTKQRPLDSSFVWNLQHAPLEITAKAKKIPSWQVMNGVAYQPPTDREGLYKGKVDTIVHNITLVPYGFTKVRVVAFPVVP
jgi:DUF1680 family protein